MSNPLGHDPGYFIVHRRDQEPAEREAFYRALVYCLHLPRTFEDLVHLPIALVDKTKYYEPAHRIGFLQYPFNFRPNDIFFPTLLLAPDDLLLQTEQLSRAAGAPLGAIGFNDLNQETLARHWGRITDLLPREQHLVRLSTPIPLLLDMGASTPMRLAVMFLSRHFGLDALLNNIADVDDTYLIDLFITMHQLIDAFASVGEPHPPNFEDLMEQKMAQRPRLPRVPLVLGTRTPSRKGFDWELTGVKAIESPTDEQLFISILSHRTLASKGIGLRIADVPMELMQRFRQFEDLCSETPLDIPKIWWVLDAIGRDAGKLLGGFAEAAPEALARLLYITVFSDFPIGLALVGDASAPLQFQRPVSYRQVTPLAVALKNEIELAPLVYLRGGFRVLVAECLDPSDPLFSASQSAWQFLSKSLQGLTGTKCEIVRIRSVEELNLQLERAAVDILIISGHGGRNSEGCKAGVAIGGNIWSGEGIAYGPSVVVINACEVVPRSSEILNIADVLSARGAKAVIGTLGPITFGHSAAFLFRFFRALFLGIKGEEIFWRLDQAWQATLCANVINDILYSSERLLNWATMEWDRMMDQYIERLLDNRISASHIYRDVERFLRDYATDCGVLDLYEDALQSRSYFPESLMYVLIGRPERIILRDERGEAIRSESTLFDRLGRRKRD